MKETLLQRCQREAREKLVTPWDYYNDAEGTERYIKEEDIDQILANTLKQAAEALEGMKGKEIIHLGSRDTKAEQFYAQALTDAQKLLLGEDND